MEERRPFSSCRLFFLFSSSNLSRRRLDVYHTSTHGVVLVRIQDAGLKCAARGSLETQYSKVAKNRSLGTIAQLCRAISLFLFSLFVSVVYCEVLCNNKCDKTTNIFFDNTVTKQLVVDTKLQKIHTSSVTSW